MVDSGENNAKITKKSHVFFSFYILHLAYKFVTLLHKLIILLMHLVRFFLYKAIVP